MDQLERLDAWRLANDLADLAYTLTMRLPISKHFALTDQIRRAAISIPANIAEGYALGSSAQFIRCLRISLGSAAELRTHLELAGRLELVPAAESREAIELCKRSISVLVGLLRGLSRKAETRVPFPVSRFPIKKAETRVPFPVSRFPIKKAPPGPSS